MDKNKCQKIFRKAVFLCVFYRFRIFIQWMDKNHTYDTICDVIIFTFWGNCSRRLSSRPPDVYAQLGFAKL